MAVSHTRIKVGLVSVTEQQRSILTSLTADARRALDQEGLDYASSDTVETVAAALDYALELLGMPGLDDEEGGE